MHILDDPVSKPSVVIKIYQVAVYFSFRINLQSFVVVPVSKRCYSLAYAEDACVVQISPGMT